MLLPKKDFKCSSLGVHIETLAIHFQEGIECRSVNNTLPIDHSVQFNNNKFFLHSNETECFE